jgi:hypothetical protein
LESSKVSNAQEWSVKLLNNVDAVLQREKAEEVLAHNKTDNKESDDDEEEGPPI